MMKAESPAELILPACPLLALGKLALPIARHCSKRTGSILMGELPPEPHTPALRRDGHTPHHELGELALNAWA